MKTELPPLWPISWSTSFSSSRTTSMPKAAPKPVPSVNLSTASLSICQFPSVTCHFSQSFSTFQDMKISSPVLALLSALLTGEMTEPALSTVTFDSPAKSDMCCPVLSACSQFVDIVHCHVDTLPLRLPANLVSSCIGQLFKYHSVKRDSDLGDVLGDLLGNRELLAREDLMRTSVKEAAGRVLEEGLQIDKTTSKLLRRLSKGQFGEADDDEKNTKSDVKGALADLGYSEEWAAGPETLKWSHLIKLQARGADGLVAAALERIKAANA